MQGDPRLGHSGGVTSAKGFVAKAAAVVVGGIMLVGAFVISLAFFAFILAAGLVVGGYLWWKTRDLRRQLREQMRQHDSLRAGRAESPAGGSGTVIEGVVVSKRETSD